LLIWFEGVYLFIAGELWIIDNSQAMVEMRSAADVLKRARLVNDRRTGRETHYRVRIKGLAPLIDWISIYAAFWRERIDALEELLGRMDDL